MKIADAFNRNYLNALVTCYETIDSANCASRSAGSGIFKRCEVAFHCCMECYGGAMIFLRAQCKVARKQIRSTLLDWRKHIPEGAILLAFGQCGIVWYSIVCIDL